MGKTRTALLRKRKIGSEGYKSDIITIKIKRTCQDIQEQLWGQDMVNFRWILISLDATPHIYNIPVTKTKTTTKMSKRRQELGKIHNCMTIILSQCSSIYIYQQMSNQVNLIVMWSMDVKYICTPLLWGTQTQAQARNQAKDTSYIVKGLWKILIWLTVRNRSNHHILKSSNEDKKSHEGRAPNYVETHTRNTFKHEDSWKKIYYHCQEVHENSLIWKMTEQTNLI